MKKSFVIIIFSLFLAIDPFEAHALHIRLGNIPSKAVDERGAVMELATKYGVPMVDPAETKPLALCFLVVMEKVLEKCEREGSEAVSAEDLETITLLHERFRGELTQYDIYLRRREEIERILSEPEEPQFVYTFGLAGFLSGDVISNSDLVDLEFQPGHRERGLTYSLKPYAHWRPADWLDIHAEGQGYGFAGGDQSYNQISLYQGYVKAGLPESDLLELKGGRQEFEYGSSFILGSDSFLGGLTFDAVRLRINPLEPFTLDLLGGSYGAFSEGFKGNLWGAYATWSFFEEDTLEAYAIRDSGSMERHAGEYLAIWGLRGTATFGPLSLELEPVYESGLTLNSERGRNDRIHAFGGHVDVSVESTLGGHHYELFASYAYGSGSADPTTSTARQFRNHNNNSFLTGDIAVVQDLSGIDVNGHSASGLRIYTLGWGIDITEKLNLSATGHYFLANKVERGFSRNLGLETDYTATYAMSEKVSFIAGYSRFFTSDFFLNASGSSKDINYGYLMAAFDLSKGLKPKLFKRESRTKQRQRGMMSRELW